MFMSYMNRKISLCVFWFSSVTFIYLTTENKLIRLGDKILYIKCEMFKRGIRDGCLNTIMNETAFFLSCHSGFIISDWNLQFEQDKTFPSDKFM